MSIPQSDIDHILRMEGNADYARMKIATEFSKGKSVEEIAAFLQSSFHGGNGVVTENGRYSAWYAEDGIHIANGDAARYLTSAKVVSWREAAERIRCDFLKIPPALLAVFFQLCLVHVHFSFLNI